MSQAILLFGLILVRMSGAIAFHPLFGHSSLPRAVRGAFVFELSLMLYMWTGGELAAVPVGVPDFAVMVVKELLVGFCMGFGMELSLMVVRFAGSIIDYSLGLSMAHIYDPSSGTQMTVMSALYYNAFMLIFLSGNGHLRYLRLVFGAARMIPFGAVQLSPELPTFVLQYFCECIVLGMQLALPIVGIELLTEVAVGLLMRVVPQINIFAVNFAIKLIVGMAMTLILFSPAMDKIREAISSMFDAMSQMIRLLG